MPSNQHVERCAALSSTQCYKAAILTPSLDCRSHRRLQFELGRTSCTPKDSGVVYPQLAKSRFGRVLSEKFGNTWLECREVDDATVNDRRH